MSLRTNLRRVIVNRTHNRFHRRRIQLALRGRPRVSATTHTVTSLTRRPVTKRGMNVNSSRTTLNTTRRLTVGLFSINTVITIITVSRPRLTIIITRHRFQAPLPTPLPPMFNTHQAANLRRHRIVGIDSNQTLSLRQMVLFYLKTRIHRVITKGISPTSGHSNTISRRSLTIRTPRPINTGTRALQHQIRRLSTRTNLTRHNRMANTRLTAAGAIRTNNSTRTALNNFSRRLLRLITSFILRSSGYLRRSFDLNLTRHLRRPERVHLTILRRFRRIVTLPAMLSIGRAKLTRN